MVGLKQLKVCWLSAGVSSFIAGYLAKNVNKYIYIDIENQHEDSMRFIKDCEKVLSKDIEILKSPYRNVQNVILSQRYVNGPGGAKCTQILKRRVRKEWEYQYRDCDITYVWGFDVNEKKRADRLLESMPEFKHEFPLIDKGFTKSNSHALLERLGIKRPKMYDLGYSNNNCVGCVKGGMGYWNKIRKDFPEVFKRMAEIEREIGHSCIKGIFLDQLDPNRGRANEVIPDCGIACQLALDKEV